MTQADSVHSTPPTNTPIDERTIEQLNYFLRLEPDMNRLRNMVEIVQIVWSAPHRGEPFSAGVTHTGVMDLVIDHLELMVEGR
jgi:hypothetical protein